MFDNIDWKALLLLILTRIIIPLLSGGAGALTYAACC